MRATIVAVACVLLTVATNGVFAEPLDTTWELYWNILLPPGQIGSEQADEEITLPWSTVGRPLPTQLTLRTIVPLQEPGLFALKIPYLGAAYRAYVNGELVAETGRVKAPFRAQYLPTEAVFNVPEAARGDGTAPIPVELVLHVANNHHRRLRLTHLWLDPAKKIHQMTVLAVIKDSLLFGSLLLLAAYHLLLYLLYRRDRASLFFGLIAWLTAMRVGITTERILVRLWQDMPPEVMMKFGFAPVFLLLPLFVLYIHELRLFSRVERLVPTARWAGIVGAVLILAFPVRVYDWIFQYFSPLLILGSVIVFVLIVRSVDARNRQGATILFGGGLVVVMATINDYLREVDIIDSVELLSSGILVFLLLQAFFLARRYHDSYLESQRLGTEVLELNRNLESRITRRTEELAAANRLLETLSRTDGLTGLANRRHFDQVYEREWDHARRDRQPLGVILVDVDRFKNYNDWHGHLEGDRCLVQVAEALQDGVRRRLDLVARYGGEEFVILLPDTPTEQACSMAEELRRQVELLGIPHDSSPEGTTVTVSIGVAAIIPAAEDEGTVFLGAVDDLLYQAKERGRNRVVGT